VEVAQEAPLRPGDVWSHKKFKFKDGKEGEKLFIILCEGDTTKPYLVSKTTSQVSRYPKSSSHGCSIPLYQCFLLKHPLDFFQTDTWIQFEELYEFSIEQLLEDLQQKVTEPISKLKPENIRALLNCAGQSIDLPEGQIDRIKATSKALRASAKSSN